MWWRMELAPEIEAAISRVRIFSTLEPNDLKKLAAACLLRHYATGEPIINEGSTGLGMFLITAGRVEVFKTHDGRKIPLAILGGGDVLGEMALLDDKPRSASAVALEQTDCLLLSRDRFRTLLKRRPRIAWPIVPSLARRVRDLQEQLLEAQNRVPEHGSTVRTVSETPAPEHAPDSNIGAGGSADADGSADGESSGHAEGCAGDSNGDVDSRTDVLRAPYAMFMTGAVCFGESARLLEVFFRSLDETSGLADGRPMHDVVRDFPQSLATAGKRSWDRGRRLPSTLIETFSDSIRSDWHGEDPD